jgi:hypothetical protein
MTVTALDRHSPAGDVAPRIPWPLWRDRFIDRWEQGDHVSLIGRTKSGKSTLALELLESRTAASTRWATAILANKPRDRVLTAMSRRGWRRIVKWPPKHGERRVLLWPGMKGPEGFATQAAVFDLALRQLFEAGRWCVYADEIRYLAHTLRLQADCELLWLQGQSNGLTFVSGTQRAAWVPLEFYTQVRHLLLFREASPAARRRLIEHCGGANGAEVARVVASLEHHEFVHVDTVTGTLSRSRVELGK